jgi:hypothetical protein
MRKTNPISATPARCRAGTPNLRSVQNEPNFAPPDKARVARKRLTASLQA